MEWCSRDYKSLKFTLICSLDFEKWARSHYKTTNSHYYFLLHSVFISCPYWHNKMYLSGLGWIEFPLCIIRLKFKCIFCTTVVHIILVVFVFHLLHYLIQMLILITHIRQSSIVVLNVVRHQCFIVYKSHFIPSKMKQSKHLFSFIFHYYLSHCRPNSI